jgi:hypothetical protein
MLYTLIRMFCEVSIFFDIFLFSRAKPIFLKLIKIISQGLNFYLDLSHPNLSLVFFEFLETFM